MRSACRPTMWHSLQENLTDDVLQSPDADGYTGQDDEFAGIGSLDRGTINAVCVAAVVIGASGCS
jgi:hypothetical protein